MAPASLKYPDITVLEATQWNISTHAGSIRSFVSVVTHGPTAGQQVAWNRLSLQKRKILIIVATEDPIILPKELKPDVEELVRGTGTEIVWRVIKGAHHFTSTDPEKIVDSICEFWGI